MGKAMTNKQQKEFVKVLKLAEKFGYFNKTKNRKKKKKNDGRN